VTFFFDNHHSPEIVQILRSAGADVVHLRDVFTDRGIDDEVWIPEIGRRGWILVTGDLRIRRRKAEKIVFQRAQIVTFFLAKEYNNKNALNRIKWILNQWEAIEAVAATAQPGDCFLVPMKGKLRKLDQK
jgi:predicted nuclease of predicted toxin-antitoxin system